MNCKQEQNGDSDEKAEVIRKFKRYVVRIGILGLAFCYCTVCVRFVDSMKKNTQEDIATVIEMSHAGQKPPGAIEPKVAAVKPAMSICTPIKE